MRVFKWSRKYVPTDLEILNIIYNNYYDTFESYKVIEEDNR